MIAKPPSIDWRRASAYACAVVTALVSTSRLQAADEAGEPVRASEQMVVAANPYASEAGIRILRAGGNAVDAAIATQLVLSLVEPQSSSVGGGAFMLYLDAGDAPEHSTEITAYEGRETAPAAATPDMFLDDRGSELPFPVVGPGGLAVGVPGVMRMLEMAHRDQGRLAWETLFEPAIELAEQGFEISQRLYFLLDRFAGFARAERFRAHYYDENGEPYPTGHLLVNTDYAATLKLLARDGADVLYTGDLAAAIVDAVSNNSLAAGQMTLEDLRGYRAHKSSALCTPYRQWRVCGPQLPSSGGVTVQQILGMLESFDLKAAASDAVASIHLVSEASRLAFADRNFYLGDSEFVDAPVAQLLSETYLTQRAALIERDSAMANVVPGAPVQGAASRFAPSELRELSSTSHFSIVDRWGNAVSMTTSVQSAFGSQLMVGGFILNNQLTDFSFEPERDGKLIANRADSGKRPLSSMTPTIVLDEQQRLYLMIGSPGGTRIINFVAQAIVSVLDWGMNIQEAVAAPHFVAQGRSIELERGTDIEQHSAALTALGHRVVSRNLNSGLHGIIIEYANGGKVLWGGVDPRREGVALGD